MAYGIQDVEDFQIRERKILTEKTVHQIMFSNYAGAPIPIPAINLRRLVGESNYKLWDLELCRDFLRDIYGEDLLEIFDSIKPFAYKADLARYCIINHFGGWYVDLMLIVKSLPFEGNCKLIAFRDRNQHCTSWNVCNGPFYSSKNSPILSSAISRVEKNVKTNFYGKNPLFPTGPSLFGRAIAQASDSLVVLFGDAKVPTIGRSKFLLEGTLVAKGKTRGNPKHMQVMGGNSYRVLWDKRDIYGTTQ